MTPEEILDQALGSRELPRKLASQIPGNPHVRRNADGDWAIFPVAGNNLAEVDRKGISKAIELDVRPVLLIADYRGLRAAAQSFVGLGTYALYEIAGAPRMIPPMNPSKRSGSRRKCPIVRVEESCLQELAELDELPLQIREEIRDLRRDYRVLLSGKQQNDPREAKILEKYATKVLNRMGLDPSGILPTKHIHTFESGGLAAGRDHFFHSFQNYFIGLGIIARAKEDFLEFRDVALLDWQIDPFDVWFLTALWHDVGYSLQKSGNIHHAQTGILTDTETLEWERERFLSNPTTQRGLRILTSLLDRIMYTPKTGWIPPLPDAMMSERELSICNAVLDNVTESHGAIGAIRLFAHYWDGLGKKTPDESAPLQQAVLLASVSMPFHDFFFRDSIRKRCGRCLVSSKVLPFGMLLAFVDSIQDDRRELDGDLAARVVLKNTSISEEKIIVAQVDRSEIEDDEILGKIVEAIDVSNSFSYPRGALSIRYPDWMDPSTK